MSYKLLCPTWISASSWRRGLHNSMKLWAMPCRATQDGWVIMERSDNTWSTGGRNGKPLYILVTRTPWTVWKDKKMKSGDEPPRLEGIHATGEEQRNNSRKNEEAGSKLKLYPAADVSDGDSKVWCCEEQYCIGTQNVISMNEGKLDLIKEEMARVNISISGIS